MAIGRKTGGRQKGTLNQRTQIMLEVVEQGGLTPLEYLLSVMRDEAATKPERLEAAKAAAPYVARATIEHRGRGPEPDTIFSGNER